MTDNPTPEDLAFAAQLDRLRAAVGPARLEEAARRGIGDQMLEQALLGVMDGADNVARRESHDLWSKSAEPNWGWEENNE
jgi:hypothetical protein